jgi:DNA-binding transcriptional regulator YiaG
MSALCLKKCIPQRIFNRLGALTPVSIVDADGLHLAIGREIVNSAAFLTGAEFRFLRLEMDLFQRQLAALINADEQAVRRWEKARGKSVKGPGERFMRVLYVQFVGDPSIRQKIERLTELDVLAHRSKKVLRKPPDADWGSEEDDCLAA